VNLRLSLIITAVVILAMAALSLAAASVLPATVPLRFNAHGAATAYGSAALPLALMPVAALLVSAVFAGFTRIEPRRDHLASSGTAYATRWVCAVAAIAIVHIWIVDTLVTTAHGANPIDPTRLVFALVGITIAAVGSQLAKVQSNFTIGIRTPWTLSSDQVWERTHRLGRLPVMLAGFAILFAAIAAPTAILLKFTMAVVFVTVAGLVLLSYLLWRGGNGRRLET
jgi:uncharacterized membrane protein